MKHTPEPWEVKRQYIYHGEKPEYYIRSDRPRDICKIYGDDAEANARRIVACVNACAGIDLERLESKDWHVLMVKTDDMSAYPSDGLHLIAEVQKE